MAGEHIRKPIARMSVGPAWLWAGFLASAIKKMSWQAAAGSAGSNHYSSSNRQRQESGHGLAVYPNVGVKWMGGQRISAYTFEMRAAGTR